MPRTTRTPFPTAEPELDEKIERLFLASLASEPDENGHYRTVTYNTGSKDYDEAAQWVRRLHRPRNRQKYKKRGKVQYGLNTEIIKLDDGTYSVRYHATTNEARLRYMLEAKGTDRTKWAYSSNPADPNFG